MSDRFGTLGANAGAYREGRDRLANASKNKQRKIAISGRLAVGIRYTVARDEEQNENCAYGNTRDRGAMTNSRG